MFSIRKYLLINFCLSMSMFYSKEVFRQDEGFSHLDQVSLQHHGRCELITVDFCLNIEYNQTIMPNMFNHQKQADAASELYPYYPLIKIKCNPSFQFFLCSVYLPVCTVLDKPIPPCRSLCLSSKKGCEDLMNKFGFPWPAQLNCSLFPESDVDPVCVSKNTSSGIEYNMLEDTNADTVFSSVLNPGRKIEQSLTFSGDPKYHEFVCPYQFKVPKGYGYSIRMNNKVIQDCGLPCNEMFFNKYERYFSKMWIGGWSALCAASCLFTVLTFLINTDRFKYPERPIIFLSVCYLMISLIYIVGYFSEDRVACHKPFPPPSPESVAQMVSTISEGTKGELCTILFIGLYFFSMASSIWWVILALTWFLAAGLKWGHEAIEANSQYFHLAAWAVPAIKTITILAMGKVEGDVLTGVCYVGVWDPDMLRAFVIIPLIVYLTLGVIFLVLGFVSLFRIRTVMKHDGTKTDKLEKLMIRIGIFSLLYVMPAVIVIGCLFYEQANFNHWMISWQHDMCQDETKRTYLISCPDLKKHRVDLKPNFIIFMLKYLMSFIVGITSSLWIWSGKTVSNWKELFYRIKGGTGSVYV